MCNDCPMGSFRVLGKGEGLQSVTEKHSLTSEQLLDANPFLNPSYYICGQVVVIPDASGVRRGVYSVARGETLCDVLRKTNASAAELMALNPCADIFSLKCGDRLNVPIKRLSGGEFYRMRQGEDLSSLSRSTGKTQLELLRMNPNLRPCEFTSGQTVRIGIKKQD